MLCLNFLKGLQKCGGLLEFTRLRHRYSLEYQFLNKKEAVSSDSLFFKTYLLN